MMKFRWLLLISATLSLIAVTGAVLPAPPGSARSPVRAQTNHTLIDDFESDDFADRWWNYTDDATVSFLCTRDNTGYATDHSLRLAFITEMGGAPGCGMGVQTTDDWAAADGLSFFWRSDQAGVTLDLVLNVADPTQTNPDAEGLTPFIITLASTGTEWTPVILRWEDFQKSDWVGESGTNTVITTQVAELIFQVTEAQSGSAWIDDLQLTVSGTQPLTTSAAADFDKFELWIGGTQLRGANIWQRIVVPEVDGDEFLGNDYVGPPYVQEDFDRLAALGANYVNVSGPGLFTERPPYVLDEAVQTNLDNILSMIAQADMFAVITFRTGPGRSDFTFYDENIEEWADPSLVIDDVWVDQAAQDAWVEMWRYTAARYRDNPIVVGYDLMCEPNAAGRLLDIWDGETFYQNYAGTLYDWNQLYPRLVEAIREVDSDTPILISAAGWGAVSWLPYLKPVNDSHTVYMVHQYEPQESYTHQDPSGENTYPGRFDVDWDDVPDEFNYDWLDQLLTTIDEFKENYGVPVGVNEFGVARWVPDGAAYMRDLMVLFEERGMNHALWAFNPAWTPFASNDDFDFLHGPDPNHHSNVATSDLIEVIRANWSQNTIRPSNVGR